MNDIYLASNHHNFVSNKIFRNISITVVIEKTKCWVQTLGHNPGLILKLAHVPVPHISALCDSMGVELHQHEQVDQHPPNHGLICSQVLAGLGLTKVSCQLECLDVADSTDQERPESSLLDSVLMRDKVEQTVLDRFVPSVITKFGEPLKN